MSTGFYTGRTGALQLDDKDVAKIRDWSIETSLELLSTNTIDSSYNTFVPGVVGATGSATLMYYRLNTEETTAQKVQFNTLLDKIMKGTGDPNGVGTDDRVVLRLKVGTDPRDTIRVNAYITSASVSVSTGELTVVPINVTVDGAFVGLITNT